MKKRKYQKGVSVPALLARIIESAQGGDVDAAKSLSDMVAVQTAKATAFGKTAVADVTYDARCPSARVPYENSKNIQVAASCVTHCNDDDYGPPMSDEHKLVEWLAGEVTHGIARGLPRGRDREALRSPSARQEREAL
jgi:hypothetical protein